MKKKRAKNNQRLVATALSLSLVIGGGVSSFANAESVEVPVVTTNADGGSQSDAVYLVNPLTQKFEALVLVDNDKGKVEALQHGKELKSTVLFGGQELLTLEVNEEGFQALQNIPNIKHVEKNVVIQAQDNSFSANSRLVSVTANEQSSWGYEKENFGRAWSKGYTGKGIKIAVLDSGVSQHKELAVSGGISMVDYTSSYVDDNGHGTHVVGILNAKKDNSGIVGVAPDAEVYAVKVINQSGEGSIEDIAEGVNWAIQNDMDIINMSIGTFYNSDILNLVIKQAVDNGIVVVASAGNEGVYSGTGENLTYPARLSSVISVAAVDESLKRGSFSSTGAELDISAPGVDIVSTSKSGNYESRSGTSMATPFISGMVAIIKEAYPNMSPKEIQEMIQSGATDLGTAGRDSKFGYGFATFDKLFIDASEIPAVDPVVLQNATTAVEKAERYKTSYYINKAVSLVSALPVSPEKTQLATRMQQLGAMKETTPTTEPSTPTTEPTTPTTSPSPSEPTTTPGVDPAQLSTATKYVGYAEKYGSTFYKNKAVEEVSKLPQSTEKDALVARLQKLGLMLDSQPTTEPGVGSPTKEEEVPNSNEQNSDAVLIDPAALDKATKYVGYAEKYRSSFYLKKAQEYVNALPDSQQKTELNNRLQAI